MLWIYFSYPEHNLDYRATIALAHFCVPALLSQIILCFWSWNLLSSHNVDDDVRTATILDLSAVTINVTITVLYPAYLLASGGTLNLISPGLWLLLTVPVLILLFGGILPFVAGSFRYKAAVASQRQWRLRWISQMLKVLQLPSTAELQEERSRLVDELDGEIRFRLSENPLMEKLEEAPKSTRLKEAEPIIDQRDEGAELIPVDAIGPDVLRQLSPSNIRVHILAARNALKGENLSREYRLPYFPKWVEQIRELIATHREKLPVWDPSFFHLSELLDLRNSFVDTEKKDLRTYLNYKLQRVKDESIELEKTKKKGVARTLRVPALVSAVSTVAVVLLKVYEQQIVGLVGSAIRFH